MPPTTCLPCRAATHPITQGGDGAEGNDAPFVDPATLSSFYGQWQTKEWKPQAAANGRVPRNERGNVEVPPFTAALPEGTVREPAGATAGVAGRRWCRTAEVPGPLRAAPALCAHSLALLSSHAALPLALPPALHRLPAACLRCT